MIRISRVWITALLALAVILVSCQSHVSPVDSSSTSPIDVYLLVKANRIHPPDSLQSFKSPADTGVGIRSAMAADSNYQVQMHLSHPLNGDILKFHYTSLGLFVLTANCTQSGTDPRLNFNSTDTTASEKLSIKLLADFDSARTSVVAAHSKSTDPVSVQIADLRAFYATQLLQGNAAYSGFPANSPAGMDTVGLRNQVLSIAAGSGKTLSQLTKVWNLDLDSAMARTAIVALVANGAITDTSKVFPLPAVRLKQSVTVTPKSVVVGARASVSGSFAWNSGALPVVSTSVLSNGVAATGVRVLSSANISQADTLLSLTNAYLVEVDASADTGTYSLVIQLTLGSDVARSEARFVVVAAAKNVDLTPPALAIVSPSRDTSVPNATQSLTVIAMASDSSGIDSVKIGNQKLTTAPYSASVDLAVGVDTILIQAWDKAKNRSTRTVVVTRAPIPSKLAWTGLKDVAMAEDSAVTVSIGLTGIKGDSARIQVVSGDTSIVSIPAFSKPSGTGTAQVSFQLAPRANANGLTTFKLVARDASDSAFGQFQLQVVARNDAPTFSLTKTVAAINGTAQLVVSGWATGISAGPKDEAAQKLTFEVAATDQADLLVGLPTIDSTGTLRVQAKPGVSGSAKFHARLIDNGDSTGANQNKSPWQDFVISVNAAPTLTLPVRTFSMWQSSVQSIGSISLQDDETSAANLTLKRTSSNNALLPADSVYLSGTGGSRKVTLHPVSGRTGSCTVYFQVQDTMGGSNRDSLVVLVKGKNRAPSFTLSSASIQLQNYNRDSLLPKCVVSESANDSLQYIVSRRVDLVGQPLDSFFTAAPTLDASGTLHLPRNPNAHGSVRLRITIKDNGGTEAGGTDTAFQDLNLFFSDTVIDAADGNIYHYLVLGNRSWFRENLRRQPKWGTVNTDSNGVLYHWAQGFDKDSAQCDYAACLDFSTPYAVQGLCPVGWNIPMDAEWDKLVKWADNGLSDSVGSSRLRSRTSWTWTGAMGSIVDQSGTDDWGFGVKPSYYWHSSDGSTPRDARFWANAMVPDSTDGTLGRVFAGLFGDGFKVWGLGANRYDLWFPIRCVKTVPPGQW